MLLWVDYETTGLHADQDLPLELGMILTDENLVEVDRFCEVIHHGDSFETLYMDQVVRNMHERNGLAERYENLASPEHSDYLQVQNRALSFLERHNLLELPEMEQRPPMCGSTINFDRSFMNYWMPDLHAQFHYRNVDVSTCKRLQRMWLSETAELCPPPVERKIHRPLDDLEDSIAYLRWFRAFGMVPR